MPKIKVSCYIRGCWTLAFATCTMVVPVTFAYAESVTNHQLTPNKSDYPCFLELSTDKNKRVVFQLSDYQDIWSMNIVVPDRSDVYRNFFDKNKLRDEDKMNQAFTQVTIGSKKFALNEVTLLEVRLKDVNDKTTAFFGIKEKHNVAAALDAMTEDGISIPGLVALTDTVNATEGYRQCAYDAMGVSSEETVEYDSTAEFRMIFEKSFETWIASMARAEACMQARFDEDEVEEIISNASDAFFPGLFNMMKRGDYEVDLNSVVPLAKLSGLADAQSKGCLLTGSLSDMSKMPVEQAIEAAQEAN